MVVSQASHRPFPQVVEEVCKQWPAAVLRTDDMSEPFGYLDWLRLAWGGMGDLVNVEGDVLPPPGAIHSLLECEREWCSYPLWLGTRFVFDSLGLTKFSRALQLRLPQVMEVAALRAKPGPVHFKARTPPALPRRLVGVVPVPAAAVVIWPELKLRQEWLAPRRGTTTASRQSDAVLSLLLQRAGAEPHVHRPEPYHLRYASHIPAWATAVCRPDQEHGEFEV